ncbi:hypothetical protein BGZ46_000451, partial [Entomortierella lignicola]
MNIIARGKVRSRKSSGALDNRVDVGARFDTLQGYVVIAIGCARVLVHSMESFETEYACVKALE